MYMYQISIVYTCIVWLCTCTQCTLYMYIAVYWVHHVNSYVQLKFEEDLAITRMYSGEGEDVEFSEVLYPRGNVEDWLLEVERVMRDSLRKIIGDSLEDYVKVSTILYTAKLSLDCCN